jgi:Mandelate racemase / muconate lactonizing enzyme, N-terminal domain
VPKRYLRLRGHAAVRRVTREAQQASRRAIAISRCKEHPFAAAPITRVVAHAYTIPTDAPEADGTFEWSATTLVVAEIEAAAVTGLGYTYSDACVATLIRHTLADVLLGEDASDIQRLWLRMQRRVRNLGRDGVAATAISALAARFGISKRNG